MMFKAKPHPPTETLVQREEGDQCSESVSSEDEVFNEPYQDEEEMEEIGETWVDWLRRITGIVED